ncbi:HupE/UreJ family protein [Pontiella agarivorans]|uniref:HupE/UreJ family protein n=1 Tax=Pontiella agarivorans TaxID=3038953 RepID=A0ABU5MV07_9BACT|nr:HupE/UreJ family protein [Pontiella agarivorans]MDZ8117990.1 HupE/UreJ family protein [Pontiella agarivorans]
MGAKKKYIARCAFFCFAWFMAWPSFAHEMNTAYLELREREHDVGVLVRIPEFGKSFSIVFPEGSVEQSEPITRIIEGGTVKTWRMAVPEGLENEQIGIPDLEINDLLIRVQLHGGSVQTLRLTPEDKEFTITGAPSQAAVAGTYFVLGLEHILEGIDHLLFVQALLILVKGWKKLTGAITTFTVAHSITLALASLGFVHVPAPPVEAIIALSIVFVACEIIHGRQGRPGITEKSPWLVTLSFGLLHGLGFAGALSEIGLPQHAIPMALLFFNVGVEAGQLLFVFAVLFILGILRFTKLPMPGYIRWIPPYAIGTVAMFWVIERVAGF